MREREKDERVRRNAVEDVVRETVVQKVREFLKGFYEIMPRSLISIFDDAELELLISGLPDIDVEDLRANTDYNGYSAGSRQIVWFWDVVRSLEREDLARLLQFITGTVWKLLFGAAADSLEKSVEEEDEFMIVERSPLVSHYISNAPCNCCAFVAGIVRGGCIPPLYLPYISPMSPLYLPYILSLIHI